MQEKLELLILNEIYVEMQTNERDFQADKFMRLLDNKEFDTALKSLQSKLEILEFWNDKESAVYDSVKMFRILPKGIHRHLMNKDENYRNKYEAEIEYAQKTNKNMDAYRNWLIFNLQFPFINFRDYCIIFDLNLEEVFVPELVK